jgi:PhnB protein
MTVTNLHARLVVHDAARAIDFYAAALGARERSRHTGPDGRIVHAEVTIGPATIALKDEGDGDPAPPTLGGTPVILELHVDDVDAVGAAMESAGATVIFPIADRPYGVRDGRLADPFGHLWIISRPLPDPS